MKAPWRMRALVALAMLSVMACAGDDGTGSGPGSTSSTVRPSTSSSGTSSTPPTVGGKAVAVVHLARGVGEEHFHLELTSLDGGEGVTISTPEDRVLDNPDVRPDGAAVAYHDDLGVLWTSSLEDPSTPPTRIDAEGFWGCPRWRADGRTVLAVSSEDALGLVDVASGDIDLIDAGLPGHSSISCADPNPDGSKAVVAAARSGEADRNDLRVVDLVAGGSTPLASLPDGCIVNDPAWSPDGSRVAVDAICNSPEHNGIWIVSVAPGGGRPSTPTKAVGENPLGAPRSNDVLQYWGPSWMPDGGAVLYHRVSMTTHPAAVWEVRLESGVAREVVGPVSSFPSVVAVPQ